jgi:hypothetical protein
VALVKDLAGEGRRGRFAGVGERLFEDGLGEGAAAAEAGVAGVDAVGETGRELARVVGTADVDADPGLRDADLGGATALEHRRVV